MGFTTSTFSCDHSKIVNVNRYISNFVIDAPCFQSQLNTWEAMGGAGQRKQEAILKKEIEQVAIVDHVIMMRMRRLNLQYFI